MENNDYQSKKYLEKVRKWRRKRDLLYLFFLVWMIILPEDFLISVPLGLLSYAGISWAEKKSGLQ